MVVALHSLDHESACVSALLGSLENKKDPGTHSFGNDVVLVMLLSAWYASFDQARATYRV